MNRTKNVEVYRRRSTLGDDSPTSTLIEPRTGRALAAGARGIESQIIAVTATVRPGQGMQFPTLAANHARELRVRLRSSLSRVVPTIDDYEVAVTVDPAPGDHIIGSVDLAMAAAILEALGRLPRETLADTVLVGELGLKGDVRAGRGTYAALASLPEGIRRALVAEDAQAEATSAAARIAIGVVRAIQDLEGALTSPSAIEAAAPPEGGRGDSFDMADVRGHKEARYTLEIAAAGGHSLLFVAPPGSGATMLARRMTTILEPLSPEVLRETHAISSVGGVFNPSGAPPFRAPHHTVSQAGLLGGGLPRRPGEVSLAHGGCLFLDDVTEFRGDTLAQLVKTLRAGRAGHGAVVFPARPLLVMSTARCPRGCRARVACACSAESRTRHVKRLQETLLPFVDLWAELEPVSTVALSGLPIGEPSEAIRARVTAARARRRARLATAPDPAAEAAMLARLDSVSARCRTPASTPEERQKVLRVARTIADLDGAETVNALHIREAYRHVFISTAPIGGIQ